MFIVHSKTEKADTTSFSNICQLCDLLTNDENMPVVGECGHTFCEKCVENKGEMKCPHCSAKIYLNNIKHYGFKLSKRMCQKTFYSRDEVEEMKKNMIDQKKLIDFTLREAEAFLQNPEYKNLTHSIITLKLEEMNEEVQFLPEEFLTPSLEKRPFLIEIYKEVKSGTEFLTFHRIDTTGYVVKFGKISVWGNILHFHTLQLNNPNGYDKFIRFSDIKNRLFKCHLFLKISFESGIDYVIMIKLINSVLSHHVVCLCTGETGPSYVGGTIERNNWGNFRISSKEKGVESSFVNLLATHCICDPSPFPMEKAHYVTIDPRGSLEIRNTSISVNESHWVVGVLVEGFAGSADLFAISSNKGEVVDCGISFAITK